MLCLYIFTLDIKSLFTPRPNLSSKLRKKTVTLTYTFLYHMLYRDSGFMGKCSFNSVTADSLIYLLTYLPYLLTYLFAVFQQ